jgi:hypothetical protein
VIAGAHADIAAAEESCGILGKDTFGRERIENILVRLMQLDDEFRGAYTIDKEADYLQEKLDQKLRELYGDGLIPFSERQPYVKQMGYKKSQKGWV